MSKTKLSLLSIIEFSVIVVKKKKSVLALLKIPDNVEF